MARSRRGPFVVLAMLFLAAGVRAQSPAYVLRDLGTLPGSLSSIAWGINARGDVVGWSGNAPTRAFLYRDGVGIVGLPGLTGQTYTLARGINDVGVVVGSGWGPGLPQHALRWTNGVAEDLGVLDGTSEGWGINRSATTVGSSPSLDNMVRHAFMHSDAGGMLDISPSWNASAYDVNDIGEVVGNASVGAFLWSPSAGFQPLGIPEGFAFSHGQAVNISGQVAGDVASATGNRQRVIRYTPGLGLVVLGGVGEVNVSWGMNAQGSIVGEGRPTSGLKRAFLYTDAGGLQALNDLVDASPQWFLLLATDINDRGQIVGYGFDNASQQMRAFRLDPVATAAPLAHLALNPVRVEGGTVATGWVTLTDPAPPGGASVSLGCDAPELATSPASVQVLAGFRHASFPVVTTNPASPTSARLTASYVGSVRTASLVVDPAAVTAVPRGTPGGGLRVMSSFPNPALTEARVRFELQETGDVAVRVLDVQGRPVRVFRLANRPAGSSEVVWDLNAGTGGRVSPGVYELELEAGDERAVTRVVVMAR